MTDNQEHLAPRTIAKVVTRSAFLHIQDALDIGKLALWVGRYQKGQGTSSQATGYISADAARVVFGDLLLRGGLPAKLYPDNKWEAFGGGQKDGAVVARVVTIREDSKLDKTPIVFEVATGPGVRLATGAIKPLGKLDKVSCYMSVMDARMMAAALVEELQAACVLMLAKERRSAAT